MSETQDTDIADLHRVDGEHIWAIAVQARPADGRSLISVLFNEAQVANNVVKMWPTDFSATLNTEPVGQHVSLTIAVHDQDAKRAVFNALSGLHHAGALEAWELTNAFLHYEVPFNLDWRPAQA